MKTRHPNEDVLDRLCLLYGWRKISRGPLSPDGTVSNYVGTIMVERSPHGPFLHLMWSESPDKWLERFVEADKYQSLTK